MYAPTQPYHSGRSAGGVRSPPQYASQQQLPYGPVAGHPQKMYPPQHPQQHYQQQPRYPAQMAQGYPVMQQQAMYQQQQHPGYPQHQQQQQQQQHHSSRSHKPHKGTLAPGQPIRVGKHLVRIEKYLSEGGYAHVYLTTSEQPIYPPKATPGSGERGYTQHCLKRVAFQDENVWKDVQQEIQVMFLVQYLDSSYQRLPDGTFEVFILMEFCSGGGIIDLLNQRLRNRLSEREILEIFTDVCEAVAAMHAMEHPLLHRDLKIENVLSTPIPPNADRPGGRMYKLCDFGSTVAPSNHAPTTKAAAEALAHDLNKHTTLQYRSPEMVDPMFQRPVGLPSDVWALGVLLYKLCYYTTPFETQGILAIANAKYEFPTYPNYSPPLQHLIAGMLMESPAARCTVFEALRVAHELNHTRPAVDYSHLERTRRFSLPAKQAVRNPKNALDFTDPSEPARPVAPEVPLASTVQPQRRGRPTRDPRDAAHAQVSPQPMASHRTTPALQRIPSMKSSSSAQSAPTPPAVQHPAPHLPSGSVASAKSKFEQHASKRMSLPHRSTQSPVNRLQVTGESRKNASSRKSSVDAFGLHSVPKVTSPLSFGDSFSSSSSSRDGFSDAFGAKVNKHPERQFTDAFKPAGAQQRSVSAVSGFSDSFSATQVPAAKRSVSGFSDSFTNPKIVTSPAPSTARLVNIDDQMSNSGLSTHSADDRRSSSRSPSSIPEGELSFETRYPSVETLHGGSTTSPSNTRPKGKELPQVPTAKDDSSPEYNRRASTVVLNHTGGDIPKTKMSHVSHLKQPQPRSTQVTGTAFKGEPRRLPDEYASLEPPASGSQTTPSPTADYLDLLDDEETTELLAPTDLMDEDDNEGGSFDLKPLRPSVSKSPNSGSRFGVPPPTQAKKPLPTPKPKPQLRPNKPLGAAERATLPHLSSARPASNFNSEQWSPLEALKTDSKAPSPSTVLRLDSDADSSDEDDAVEPEDPNGWRHSSRTSSPQQQRFYRRPSPDIMKRMSSFEPSSTPDSPTNKTGASGFSGTTSVYSGIERTGSSTGSVRNRNVSGASAQESGHNRRSSVIDMKTRFEALNTNANASSSSANGHGDQGGQGAQGLGRRATTTAAKPAVAAKPQTLRRLSGPRPQPKLSAGPKPPLPPTPVPKPAALRKGSVAASGQSGAGAGAGASVSSAGQGEGYAEPSELAYSKSSSGRAFPVTPQTGERPVNPRTNSNESGRSSSPEKQLPVKERIQKWNRGELKHHKKP